MRFSAASSRLMLAFAAPWRLRKTMKAETRSAVISIARESPKTSRRWLTDLLARTTDRRPLIS